MQLSAILRSLVLLSSSAAARNSNSTGSQCRQIEKLTKLVDLAANTTRLQDKTDGNATKIAEIQAKASAAADTLTTLEANTTLTTLCAQRAAVEAMASDCKLQSRLEKQLANATALTSRRFMVPRGGLLEARKKHGNGNDTIDVAAATEMLSTLSSNETLQQFCAAEATASDCRRITKLTKMVDLAANDTALAAKFKDDSNNISEFKTKAAEAQTKLAELTGNSTLTAICDAEVNTEQNANDDSETQAATNSSSSSSPAAVNRVNGNVVGGMVGSLAVYLAFIVL